MRRSTILLLALLAAPAARAEDRPSAAPPERPREMHGILSHGDSGDVMEDLYGGSVQPMPPEDAAPARGKRDPALRWDGPAGR